MNNEFKAVAITKNNDRLIVFNGNKRTFNTEEEAYNAIIDHAKEFDYPLNIETLEFKGKCYIKKYEIFGRQVTEWEQF